MNPEPSSTDSAWDRDLAAQFAAPAFPPTPTRLAARVRSRLRLRRVFRRAELGTVATAALLAIVLAWHYRPTPIPRPELARAPVAEPEQARLDVAPPVGKLDLLTQHQAAYLEALEQMEKEF